MRTRAKMQTVACDSLHLRTRAMMQTVESDRDVPRHIHFIEMRKQLQVHPLKNMMFL